MFATELRYTLKSKPRFILPLNEQREFGKKIESVVRRGGIIFEESGIVPQSGDTGFIYRVYQNKRDFSKSISIEATYSAEDKKIRFFSELAPYVVVPVIRVLLSDYMKVETVEEIVDPELPDWLKIQNGLFKVDQDELDRVAHIMVESFKATKDMHKSVLENNGVGQFESDDFDRSDLFHVANIQPVLKVFQSDFIQEIERCGLKIQRYNSDICNAIDLAFKVQEAWKTFFKKLKRRTSGARAVVEAEAAALKLVGHYFFKICSEGGSLHVQAAIIEKEYQEFVEKLSEVALYFASIGDPISKIRKRDFNIDFDHEFLPATLQKADPVMQFVAEGVVATYQQVVEQRKILNRIDDRSRNRTEAHEEKVARWEIEDRCLQLFNDYKAGRYGANLNEKGKRSIEDLLKHDQIKLILEQECGITTLKALKDAIVNARRRKKNTDG